MQIHVQFHGIYIRWYYPEHVAQPWTKIRDSSNCNQIPYTDQITDIAPYTRIYYWVTI